MRRLLAFGFLLAACHSGEAAGPAVDGGAGATSTNLSFVAARPAQGLSLLDAPARVLASPQSSAVVSAPLRGRIAGVRVRPGQRVKAGEVLIDIVMPEALQAAAALSAASTKETAWSGRRQQLASLSAEGLARAADLAEAEVKLAEARAEKQLALATLRSSGIAPGEAVALHTGNGSAHLRSPIDGIITEVNATPGESRDPSTAPLVRVEKLGELRVEARLRFSPQIGDRFELVLPSTTPIALRFAGVSPSVDTRDGSYTAWFDLPAKTTVAPGQPALVRRVLDEAAGALTVPATAVFLVGDRPHLGVRTPGGIEKREITVEALSGTDAIVRGSLKAGEEVVTDASLLPGGSP